jgi:hypothetical protein
MPRDGSAGYSEYTRQKQEHLWLILNTIGGVLNGIIQRHQWVNPYILWWDLNGGPGCYHNGSIGSPLLALQMARKYDLPFEASAWEIDDESHGRLVQNLVRIGRLRLVDTTNRQAILRAEDTRDAIRYTVYPSDYNVSIPKGLKDLQSTAKSRYGMIYSDENGRLPPFTLLRQCAEVLEHCDIIIHVAATPIKRQFYSSMHPLSQRLSEMVKTIGKVIWIVREPHEHFQWTFLIGTNWDSFPIFKRHGFHGLWTPIGREIMRRLDYNLEEYIGQLDLFND